MEKELEYLTQHSKDVAFEEDDKFNTIEQKIAGEWRWGNCYTVIVESKDSGIRYIADYRLQSGDMGPAFESCNGDELDWEVYTPEITDTDLMNFIESKGLQGNWIARRSTRTEEGFRLYSGTSRRPSYPTAREALKALMKEYS